MSERPSRPVLAEVTVEPVDGADHGRLVETALAALTGPDIERRVGPVSTVLSGDLHDVLHAIGRAHAATADASDRVVTTVRLESRTPALTLAEREREARELDESTPPSS